MRKILIAATAATVLLLSPGLVPAAAADHAQWFVGTAFNVGRLHFNIAARDPGYGRGGYYFRVEQPFRYPGHRCTSRCFKSDRYYYHDPGCPALQHHFDRYGYDPYAAFDRYAPPYREPYVQYRDRGYGDDYYDDDYYDDDYGDGRYRYDDRYDDGHGYRQRRYSHRRSPHRYSPYSCPYRH